MIVSPGSTDVTTYFMMRLAADGTAATGLTATDFDLQYTRSGSAAAAKVDATLNGNGVGGAHSDSTVIEVDATSSPGLYRVDWVDAAFAAGVQEVVCAVTVATAFAEPLRVELKVGLDIADAVWDEVLTGATHNISTSAGRRLRNIQDFGIYDLASVWVDETAGQSTGTTDGEDGTVRNRSDDFDNAQTIATSVGLDNIHIQNGNTITLAATLNGFNVWSGAPNTQSVTWSLVLNTQDIGNSLFSAAEVSGVGTGTTPAFIDCNIGITTLPPSRLTNCSILSTLTFGSAGAFRLIDCHSGVAGSSAPTIDIGAGIGATTVEFRRWSGGLTLINIEAGDVISIDGITGGTITLTLSGGLVEVRGAGQKNLVVNGSSGTVNVAGNIGVITDNSAGAVTITTTWAINRSLITGGDYALNTTASGNTGIDWANVENQGTTVGLTATTVFTTTTNTDMVGTANAALASALTTHDGKLDTLLTRIPAVLFNGITSLAAWLGIIAGKTADAGTLTEVQAETGGTSYDNTTDSLEASREKLDTISGGGTVNIVTKDEVIEVDG